MTFNQPQWNQQPTQSWPQGVRSPEYGQMVTTSEERTLATAAHLSAPIAALVSAGWLTFVGPLIVYLLYRDRSPFVRRASAGAFNFAIAMTVMGIIGWVLTLTVIFAIIGIPMIIISGLGAIILGIVGGLRTWRGESYTYPGQISILS